MGSWPLWIGFNAVVVLLLFADLKLLHPGAHELSPVEAALESCGWIALSLSFGAWIYFVHGRGPGLEFFTGYVVEKSLSTDNIFVFLVVFQYFRVASRFQHRLLYWGVLGAIVFRGTMIAAGAELLSHFSWTPYILGVFLVYSGSKLFGVDHAVRPEKNPVVRWAQKILPISQSEPSGALVVRENGRVMVTSFFLVVIVLETTDLLLAVDSIAAVFGVTRDPFVVYTSNICAILGLRALYFLLAGILRYFQYLDEGLAITVMFVGAKMLAEPWIHISSEHSLAIVAGIIGLSIGASVVRAKVQGLSVKPAPPERKGVIRAVPPPTPENIALLAESDLLRRVQAAHDLYTNGMARTLNWLDDWSKEEEFRLLIVEDRFRDHSGKLSAQPKLTVGVAVQPETFQKIRAANGSPPLAGAPADQDVIEFELEFTRNFMPPSRIDILTTKAPGGGGAIARFLEKFGEGIQQIELDVADVDRATEILRTRFGVQPIYPETRFGANGTRVNFFLVNTWNSTKVLVELVEQPEPPPAMSH